MKHPSTQAVYAYWNERRGSRPAPERGDIDPADIRRALGDTFMLAADFVEHWRFRLAGTRVCALFNREIKGEVLSSLWQDSDQATIENLTAAVTQEKIGAVLGLTGHSADGSTVGLEMLILPLAHTGHARIRALGVLAPFSPPFWLGSKPVKELRLTSLRHVGPEVDAFGTGLTRTPAQAPVGEQAEPAPLRVGGRIRHGFVVYSGGREDRTDEKAH